MKRIGYLYPKVYDMDNLRLADSKAMRCKTKSYGVRKHLQHQEEDLQLLHEMLKNKTYKTSKYDIYTIHEKKEREIYRLPYYPDRIVHHAIMNVLEPIWLSIFPYNTYSCIKGRGIMGCSRRNDKIIRKFRGRALYCLKIDITKFYPSINHEVMKTLVRKKIKDKDLLWLIDEIIDSADGLPIGNYLSQYLANLTLAYMMHYVNEVLRVEVVEYADDIVFFADNKDTLHNAFNDVREHVEKELHLSIKGNYQIFPIAQNRYDKHGRALDYVGYKFFRNQKLIRKSIKQNLCRKVASLPDDIDYKSYKMAISPWLGWVKYCNGLNLIKTITKNKQYYDLLRQETLRD